MIVSDILVQFSHQASRQQLQQQQQQQQIVSKGCCQMIYEPKYSVLVSHEHLSLFLFHLESMTRVWNTTEKLKKKKLTVFFYIVVFASSSGSVIVWGREGVGEWRDGQADRHRQTETDDDDDDSLLHKDKYLSTIRLWKTDRQTETGRDGTTNRDRQTEKER